MVSSKELKNMILKNSAEWGIDPAASFYNVRELGEKKYVSIEDYYFHDKSAESEGSVIGLYSFTDKDYQEIKRKFINEIKQSPQDWKLESEGELTVVKDRRGRKHYKEGFVSKEKDKNADRGWVEIENVLRKQQDDNQQSQPTTPTNPSNTEQQSQQEQPPKEIKYRGYIYYRGSKY